LCYNIKKKIEEYSKWIEITKFKEKIVWDIKWNENWSDQDKIIFKWIINNILEERPFAQQQLFIWGETCLGKTGLINTLEKYCRIYFVPADEEFYDLYDDDEYDLVVFDEFLGGKKITFMNQFLDGQKLPIRKKGTQYLKQKKFTSYNFIK